MTDCSPVPNFCPPIHTFDVQACTGLGSFSFGFDQFKFCGDGFGNALAGAMTALAELSKPAPAACPPPPFCLDIAANGKTGTIDIGNYTISLNTAGDTWIIKDKCTGQQTRVWGDPHVDVKNDGSTDWNFNGTVTFKLADGTAVTAKTTGDKGASLTTELIITKGDQYVDVKGMNTGTLTGSVGQTGGNALFGNRDLGKVVYQGVDAQGSVAWYVQDPVKGGYVKASTAINSADGYGFDAAKMAGQVHYSTVPTAQSSGSGSGSGAGTGSGGSAGSGSSGGTSTVDINSLISQMQTVANLAIAYTAIITEINTIDKTAMSAARISAT